MSVDCIPNFIFSPRNQSPYSVCNLPSILLSPVSGKKCPSRILAPFPLLCFTPPPSCNLIMCSFFVICSLVMRLNLTFEAVDKDVVRISNFSSEIKTITRNLTVIILILRLLSSVSRSLFLRNRNLFRRMPYSF
jgi:hypothetical protein